MTASRPWDEAAERSALRIGDRIGAIDIGTNTVLLTVAERVASGGDLGAGLRIVGERHAITRLGEGVDRNQRLKAEACRRTLDCLLHYRQEMALLGVNRAVCVGTSALRDTAGGDDFVHEAAAALGCTVEVVSGAREAELTFRGALSGLSNAAGGDAVLAFDIGGGSTEIVLGTSRGDVRRAVSVNIGSVRLFERHGHERFSDVELVVRAALPPPFSAQPDVVLGIAGTMTTLWSLAYGMPFDEQAAASRALTSEIVARLARELFSMPIEQRRERLHIDEGRADVIPFGAIVAAELLSWVGAREVRVTGRGVRYGLLLEAPSTRE